MKQETNDTPFRMLVLADYCCNTGFAQVASNIMQELKKTDRFDADIIGINFTGDPYDLRRFPFNVYTAFSQADNQDVYGREKFLRMLAQGTYDIVFMIQDTFIVETFAQQINEIIAKKSYKPKTVLYYPIDAHPKISWATDAVYKFDYAVPYTHYARAETLAAAEPPKSCQLWQPIYHGVNLDEFHYVEDRKIVSTFREKWFNNGSTDGRFMVMNVNRNQPRKNILASLQALKRLRELGDEDTLLYLHMAYKDVGGDLTEMAAQLGLELGKDYIVPRPQLLAQGIDNQTMGMLYNAADAVISTTLGEGFGISIIESFATRTPIAIPDCTSFTELGADNRAVLVPAGNNAGAFTCQGPMDLNRIRPLVNVDKMAQAILDIKAGKLPDIDGAEAWAKRYSWPNVCKEWIELFVRAGSQAKLATFHEKKVQTPPVAANRATRRKAKRKKK